MKALFIILKGLSLEANNIYIFLEGESPTLRRLSSFEELSCGNWNMDLKISVMLVISLKHNIIFAKILNIGQ